ncbi:hypothetical protein E4U60_001975 [Claviceps pazoutovae]|uniref:Uncharacterized protein n=1 Tax=Claviceps pazoutovae TaxID=1649127 RepID=A0A9P7MC57_9HYPO|nr:hypothetical protein E4U60_001975 [Claviceps pazoutovae]
MYSVRPSAALYGISESAIASIGNGIGLSPEDLEFELGPGKQQLSTDLGKSVYLHLVAALGASRRGRCQWPLRIEVVVQ